MVWYYTVRFSYPFTSFVTLVNVLLKRNNIIFQQQDDYNNKGNKGQVFLSLDLDFLPNSPALPLLLKIPAGTIIH
jgi:hypothetical protein